MYFDIGSIIEVRGIKAIVCKEVEENRCDGCLFYSDGACTKNQQDMAIIGYCSSWNREDGFSIIFKEILGYIDWEADDGI
jgi:hypothetical protein